MSAICKLQIANELVDGADCCDIWLFESSMEVRRQFDFIFTSAKFLVITVEAIRAIDISSVINAVKAIDHIEKPRQIC